MSTLVNRQIGPYLLRDRIGLGGVAEVWQADHVDDSRTYAVKILRPDRLAEPKHRRCLEDEFSILEQLRHPGLPPGRRWIEVDGRAGFVMDYVAGENLAVAIAKKEPIPGIRCLHDIAATLHFLHENELIHNDIKLENAILRPDGSTVLLDLGNAKRIQWTNAITGIFRKPAKQIFGTATYLAPELIAGKKPTVATDLYAVGVAAFLLITGRPPFLAGTNEERLNANVNDAPPTLASRIQGIPMAPAAIIDACLAKKPEGRPPSAALVRDAAKDLLDRLRLSQVQKASRTPLSIRPV